ncbi:1-phosphatidylinositol 4,5-bisphosphate phosphodiesterase-like [Trichogramma pretiosum]|uniref:1-phosphatidylinositol 4,5-bisphosphate phosphodiesterase-like n=1 Tax=Trichogramma pretiosum TaxID=7493 RepID=UPI0006C9CF1C|nr:1-phosphatidylinositol 4,5-bisphosphate phosphodiesterase-like [Trichogramma pretiosum]
MTKKFEYNWQRETPALLLNGGTFDRWVEEKESTDFEPSCLCKVDKYGFFLYWKSEGKDGDVIELAQVSDIRYGGTPKDPKLSGKLSKHGNAEQLDEKTITVCIGIDYTNINYQHFVCPDAKTAKDWQAGLRFVTHNTKASNVCPTTQLMKHWMKLSFQVDPKGKVPVKVITKTFASGKTEKLVYQGLKELGLPDGKNDKIEPDAFTFDKFKSLYFKICPRNDIEELFGSITKGKNDYITCEQLVQFMNEKQRDPQLNEILYPLYSDARCMEIITDYELDDKFKSQKRISKEGFIRYLMSDENAPVFLDKLDEWMDMDQPLSHYYINSSHNTYLSGKQVGAKSSVEMYRQTLLAGCRCVELDCWDGKKPEDEIIITHGKAMCTDILFKDSLMAIRDCAFVTSEYPVILSIENHLCMSNQYKMAKYFDEIFGELLLKEALPDYPLYVEGQPLPPPSAMKRKILIKNKRLKPEVEKVELELFLSGKFEAKDEVVEDASAAAPPPTEAPPPEAAAAPAEGGAPGAPGEAGPDGAAAPAYSGSATSCHPLLSSMINYAQPVKFQTFEHAEKKNIHHNMSSFSETAALNHLQKNGVEFVNYNKRQMSRIYPKGTRVDSSNYMPQVFWNAGCQMVALNFQTPDLPMQLNQGKFEYNNTTGYLLKPEFMRRAGKNFDPFSEGVDGVITITCSVRVIAGQFLSDKKVGTYVEVDMYGLPADTIKKEFKTRMVPANGLNPVYNEDPFVFRKVVLPDLAVLRFGVYEESGKLLGQRILPLDGLQAGYRHISLKTEANFPMALPMLFCNIELSIYVPDGFGDFMAMLSDPGAFGKGAEKRDEAMKGLGIEQTDAKAEAKKKEEEEKKKKEEFKLPPCNYENLRREKFFKLGKKMNKELDTLRKKHLKERQTMQKNHCTAIEKLTKGKDKSALVGDASVKSLIKEQMTQWTQMVEKHRKEEWELQKVQLEASKEEIKACMPQVMENQFKLLEAKHAKDMKELNANQAKVSADTAKEVMNDKALKTKGDKDRRLKEKKANNIKKFMDERKNIAIKHAREKEKLKATHEKQTKEIDQDFVGCIEQWKNEAAHLEISAKSEFYV